MVDCYSFIFIKRLARLVDQLRVKSEIDGLVFLHLRNFIHDRRRAHDPLGFRVFETLRLAIRQAVSKGEIAVVAGEAKILSNTVLAFDPEADPQDAASRASLKPVVENWNDNLFPAIITDSGVERQALIERLRLFIIEIEALGIRAFHVRDVAELLKRDIRARWAALFEREGGDAIFEEKQKGFVSVVRVILPNGQKEQQDSLRELVCQVSEGLEQLDVSRKTRRYLKTLWEFLGEYARSHEMERLPSNRRLSILLDIPRERLPDLYQTLRGVVDTHRTATVAPLRTVNKMGHRAAHPSALEEAAFQ